MSAAEQSPEKAPRCPAHIWRRCVQTDPTGGDPFMGGPVLIWVCPICGREGR